MDHQYDWKALVRPAGDREQWVTGTVKATTPEEAVREIGWWFDDSDFIPPEVLSIGLRQGSRGWTPGGGST